MSDLPELIDSHCHLNYDYAPKKAEDLVLEAKKTGVSHLVTIGTDLDTIDEVQALSERFENVFHTIGVHPHDGSTLSAENIVALEAAARHPKCRAIGEIGLDYYYENSSKEAQRSSLDLQLDLALKLKLPIVVHSRDGEADLLPALTRYAKACAANPGVIHCFTGTTEFGKACIDLGFFVSFSGILTFKNANEVRDAAKAFPLDRLLVETDSPFLAPIPYRGKKCEPSMVRATATKLAEIKHEPIERVAESTTRNSRALFRI
jgi:TatD DNase family protein